MELPKNGTVLAVVSLVIGIFVSVMVLILVGALGGRTFNLVEPDISSIGDTETKVNDTITILNGTKVSLTHPYIISILSIENTTGSLGIGNFTYETSTGTITLITEDYNNTAQNVTYTYRNTTIEGHVKDSIVSSFEALEQTGNYLPIVVLAVIIMLVLGLVIGIAGGMNKGGSGNTPL